MLQFSAPVQPGNSGGPLLDLRGAIAGVVVSKLDAIKAAQVTGDIPQNINFAVKTSVVLSFLEAHGIAVTRTDAQADLAVADVAERARAFTVRIECSAK
jgi:S1-C subfamily serine protease